MKLTLNAIRGLPLLNLIVITTVIFSMFVFDTTSAAKKARRCFNCRSRGELGDCRDPFYLSANSTLVKNSKKAGVKMLPCSSGWCKKFVGGNQDKLKSDQAIEHERGCLTRGPPDNKPRCFEHDFGLMCICKGDLCNQAPSINMSYGKLFSALIVGWISLYLMKKV